MSRKRKKLNKNKAYENYREIIKTLLFVVPLAMGEALEDIKQKAFTADAREDIEKLKIEYEKSKTQEKEFLEELKARTGRNDLEPLSFEAWLHYKVYARAYECGADLVLNGVGAMLKKYNLYKDLGILSLTEEEFEELDPKRLKGYIKIS